MQNPYTQNITEILELFDYESEADVSDQEARTMIAELRESEVMYESVLAHYATIGPGATFKHQGAERYAVIMPCASGYFARFQIFDATGFLGHESHRNEQELVAGLISFGFTVIADSATLNAFSLTDSWAKGSEINAQIQAYNSGQISFAELKTALAA